MTRTSKTRPLAPTSALDHALEALAARDPDLALRWAIPALSDEVSGAPAADIVGRALVAAGSSETAADAHDLAVQLLMRQGLVPHAVAAAIALGALTGDDSSIMAVAKAFGAGAAVGNEVRPPVIKNDTVTALDATLTREQLIARAAASVSAVARPTQAFRARARLPLWSALPPPAFARLIRALTVRVCGPGEVLMREGDLGHGAFIIARGEVRVTRQHDGEQDDVELAVLGAGAIVGEMALVTDAPRFATVTATRGALVLEAPRDALDAAAGEST